ncbi:DUF308 domain-containing protein [Bradyrhizobium liaoningense]|uniref:DUF308 domain-containing protein n=1 Tax=Bradyrhizobium liaoningense TaxID=43992 RepID=UPI001BA70CCB|nr:DUF308 domain-containing protein [Bradyrhizobium liaoningense]MBR0717717.1 DUF308 domain-containing protein [Bradyrhizobium liaoningense]
MALALMIAGVVAVVAGLLTILWGISLKEFSLGSTLIMSGTIGVCSGMLLLGLFVVVQELKTIVRRLAGSTAPSDVRVRPVLPAGLATAGMTAPAATTAEDLKLAPAPPSPGASPPWQDEAAARARTEAAPPVPDPPPPPPPAEPPRRRNLLFESTSRKERERAEAKTGDAPSGAEPRPAPPPPAVPPEPPPASFDDAWPKPERVRPLEASVTRRPPPPPPRSPLTEPAAAPPAPPPPAPEPARPAPAEQTAVTVLKSGVVDGMAYSLYSDGSIEAQMPEGMMRFASIDELRAHLDQRA